MKFTIVRASTAIICFLWLITVILLGSRLWTIPEVGERRLNSPLLPTDVVDVGPLSRRSVHQGNYNLPYEAGIEETCGFWLKEFGEWNKHSDEWSSSRGYSGEGVLLDQRKKGVGDLLAGTMTGLIEAVKKRTKLFLLAPDFTASFDISDAVPEDMIELVAPDSIPSSESYDSCHLENFPKPGRTERLEFNCNFDLHRQYDCYHYNWFCMEKSVARKLKKEIKSPPAPAQVLGCPMRLLYSMSKAQASHSISWIDAGESSRGTLESLLEKVKQYRTIAVHFRGGDQFFNSKESVEAVILNRLNKTLICAHSVAGMIDDYFQTSLPIRFIVASDTPVLRDMLLSAFPENVLMIEERPTHISDIHDASKKLDMFAEWFLLGQAEFMIQNIFKEWPSSFSTTARLYHLKSDYFEVSQRGGMCVWKDYDYKGNLKMVENMFPQTAQRQQPHIESCRKRFGDKICAQWE